MTQQLKITVQIKQLAHAQGLQLPRYETPLSAGLDLPAAVAANEPLLLEPGERVLVPTGLSLALPEGIEAQVRPRSGLALKHGITVLNSPGTIDADYRGEVKVILINLGDKVFIIERGQRIAQLVIASVARAHIEVAAQLEATERGAGGFGSTDEPVTTNSHRPRAVIDDTP